MKRFSTFTSALLIFFSFGMLSCEKEQEEPLKDYCDQIDIVSAFTYPKNELYPVARLTYDGRGRISLVQSDNHLRYEYAYFEDRIELKVTESDKKNIHLTYFLDDKSRIKRTSVYNYDYRYDEGGNLVSFRKPFFENDVIGGYTQVNLEYNKGNLISVRYDDHAPYVSFTYYEQPNQELGGYNSPLYLSGLLEGDATFYLIEAGFFGNSSKQLLRRITGKEYPETEFKYQFDGKGRIISKLNAYGFKYQCD